MSDNKSLNEKIDKYILDNPKKEGENGYYAKLAVKFNSHPEKIRKRWRMIQKKTVGNSITQYVHNLDEAYNDDFTTTTTSGGTTISGKTAKKIENLEDLIKVCNIDKTKFSVVDFEIKAYNAWIKNTDNQIESKQLFSVKAQLKPRTVGNDISLQKDAILAEIAKASVKHTKELKIVKISPIVHIDVSKRAPRDCALEINIPDLHIGKLAWAKESGEDYDIKIAVERYKNAVKDLMARVNPLTLEKIILPVGNDMLNVDNKQSTTTAGTPQSCDSRFGKMFQTAKELLIDTIDELSQVAPVEVMIIPGNHDSVTMFTLGEVLGAWYHNNDEVTVINTHAPRKYIKYGQNLIMYVHGHSEKLHDLGIICATEQPKLWADTKYRRVHVGHFHHSRQVKFVDLQEYPGFTVKILNSLSANDAWHAEKGYMSLKAAEAFLYHKDKGLIANYFYLNQ